MNNMNPKLTREVISLIFAKEDGHKLNKKELEKISNFVLVDNDYYYHKTGYASLIVQDKETKDFYRIEGYWSDRYMDFDWQVGGTKVKSEQQIITVWKSA